MSRLSSVASGSTGHPGRGLIRSALACLTVALAASVALADASQPVTLVRDGEALMPLVVPRSFEPIQDLLPGEPVEVQGLPDPVTDLREQIEAMSGAKLSVVSDAPERLDAPAIYLGLASDFPWLEMEDADDLGPEGFIIRSDGRDLYLLAGGPLGVQHAVTTFLFELGQRWYFPGPTWQVTPNLPTIQGRFDVRQRPDYPTWRWLGWGFGLHARSREQVEPWLLRNRLFGPQRTRTNHTWYGIDREADFEANPEWFAYVEHNWWQIPEDERGERRRQPTKPCYSHPEVIERIIEYARSRAAAGSPSITLSPPDWLNFCECERCFEVFEGGEPYIAHLTWFAERPRDGELINVTSETFFNVVNKVAEALEEEFPDTIIASNAYSAYSHPPSFGMHPNVYINTTTAFRRTPLSMEEQLIAWGQRTERLGVRGYWSVYQWDWDNPDPGQMRPHRLQEQLQFFHANNARNFVTELSNNFAPRGLGYYIGSHLLWDVDTDVDALIRDFYEKAFGPAAEPMQRYYAMWYGPEVVVLPGTAPDPDASEAFWPNIRDYDADDLARGRQSLRRAFGYLEEAASLVADQPAYRDRVDDLRLYMLYMHLRLNTWEAVAGGDEQAILDAVRDETLFGGRLAWTNMVHAQALMGSGFRRLYSSRLGLAELLESVPEAQRGGEWRQRGERPGPDEIDTLWRDARHALGL